jgi:hypothetical protein
MAAKRVNFAKKRKDKAGKKAKADRTEFSFGANVSGGKKRRGGFGGGS